MNLPDVAHGCPDMLGVGLDQYFSADRCHVLYFIIYAELSDVADTPRNAARADVAGEDDLRRSQRSRMHAGSSVTPADARRRMAGVLCGADQHKELERLCRYITAPPLPTNDSNAITPTMSCPAENAPEHSADHAHPSPPRSPVRPLALFQAA